MKEKLAIDVFRAGIPVFEKSMFKFNEEDPEAPKSSMKINLRRDPEGNLTNGLIEKISVQFVELVRKRKIKFDLVVGLPRAGEPFAEKFVEIWNKEGHDKKRIIYLEKGKINEKRRILEKIRGEFDAGQMVLMIDDVVSLAHSKVEAAKALRKNGLIVKHCIVLMDWEFGGVEFLKNKHQLRTVSEYLVSELLRIWKEASLITNSRVEEIIKQRDEIRKYVEEHGILA